MISRLLYLAGLALNIIGTGLIFVFAYPPREEERKNFYVGLSRLALLLVFFGFLLQLAAALAEM